MKRIFTLLALAAVVACSSEKSPLEEADPFIGTGLHGHTYPGATAPFGMVQLSPDTRNNGWDGASGYHDSDSVILGFSHTHLSGTGGVDLGDFLFTPVIGEEPVSDTGFVVAPIPFSKADEEAFPGYYKVKFPSRGIVAEMTALPRTGVHRYSFSGKGERRLLVDLGYTIGGSRPDGFTFREVSDNLIEGGRHVSGWSPDRWVYFSALFSTPFVSCETDGNNRYLLTFPSDLEQLTISVGLSPVDVEGAANNRLAEVPQPDFDKALAASKAAWETSLGKITVEGGTPERRKIFYSSLYRTMVAPNLMSDADGRFMRHTHEAARVPEGRAFYSTLSIWDTFRAWNPLMTILEPGLVKNMVFTLLDTYDTDGKFPLWTLWGMDVDCMIGYHSASVIADAWLRGIRDFDGEKALQAMIVSSDSYPATQWYNEYGYIPTDLTPQSISMTLEYCYDDWCIARMAESLGHADIAAEYDLRASRWRDVFDPSTGFMRGRDSEGNWAFPFDPTGSSRDYTEAIAWQYRHFIAHDIAGFAAMMGGVEAAKASLDSLFTYEYVDPEMAEDGNITGRMGQYAHGNEPSHASAFLYSGLGDPSSTQRWVRKVMDELYTPERDGLCGNEDCGQMSAWYVLSAIGLYPMCPGTGEFVFTAPVFPKTTITLPDGNTLTITADHPEYPYIKEVTFNGERVEAQFLTYDQIMGGGELSFKLSRKPDHGRDSLKAPYSLSDGKIVSTPFIVGDPRFFDGSFTVDLRCRTEGAEIRYTLDGSEPTEASAIYEGPFGIDKDIILKAKAFKENLDPSPVMSRHAFPIEYFPALAVSDLQPGCRYTYHRGPFQWAADVLASKVAGGGVMPLPDITAAPDDDHFGYVFTGYLDIPEEGLWELAVRSDDGSVLEIDGRLAVNNDGSHSDYTATGHIALRKGIHAFRLVYLEDYEGQTLSWSWKSPSSGDFEPIPAAAVFHHL